MLPRLDGMTLCQKLRQEFQNPVPILMLTARDPVEDRVQGLALGADDYLVKPFSLTELDARIKALVRRAQGRQVQSVLAWKDLQVDTRSPQAWRQGRCIALTPNVAQAADVPGACSSRRGAQAGDGIPGLGRRATGQRRAANPHP